MTVLCDGSTDSSLVEKELIYVIFVNPETFVPTCSFFALKEPISQDAAGIKQAIEKSFREKGLSDILEKNGVSILRWCSHKLWAGQWVNHPFQMG